ncbi:MAG: glycoside hydrolase [Thermoproteota archaeon]|nr:glycoside hydrolase [Thermoproteota archaeon]
MTNSSNFRIPNIIINDNILTYLKYILFIFILNSLIYHQEINAIDESFFVNNFFEKLKYDNNSLLIDFPNSNITNLTNNKEDSIYAQIGAFENNVYVVWQESVSKNLPEHNYDIFFIKSNDKGKTFSMPINLSNNTEFSERPQIAVSKNGVFIIWADEIDKNNKEIMFTKSLDNGATFSKVINISNTLKNSNRQEISAYNKNVYVVWQDTQQNNTNSSIMFKSSIDGGNTFNDSIELMNNTDDSFPKISSYGNYVYIVWNNENKENSGLFFIRSSNQGDNFEKAIKIEYTNSGESQIAVNENKVLVVWGGLDSKNIHNIYFVNSNDNGSTFTGLKTISENITGPSNTSYYNQLTKIVKNPLNVEVNNYNLSYIVWQDTISQQNQDILLTLSNQTDNDYTKILNLSNNIGVSECPSIAISGNNVYVIWEDFISGNHEILFTNIYIQT